MKKKDFIAEDIIGKIYQNKYKKEEKLQLKENWLYSMALLEIL